MSHNDQVKQLIDDLYISWTKLLKDDDGSELRAPASMEEVERAKAVIEKIQTLDFDDETLQEQFTVLKNVTGRYEREYSGTRTPGDIADMFLDEIYEVWSVKWTEEGTEYGKPADLEEIEESREIVEEIEEIEFDDKEIQERLESYKSVLDVCEEEFKAEDASQKEFMDNEDNQKAFDLLQKIYDSWSVVSHEDGEEYRNPKNKRQINKSRGLLKKVAALNITDPSVKDRAEELENVLDANEEAAPTYWWRILIVLIASFSVIATFSYLSKVNTANIPDFEYNQDYFTIGDKGADLIWADYKDAKKKGKFNRSIHLNAGIKVKPIARFHKFNFQVELPNGQRGLIKNTDLKGSQYVVSKDKAIIFDKIADGKWENIPEGTKGFVIDRFKKKNGYLWDRYIKLKFDDGRVKWAKEKQWEVPVLDKIPMINANFIYSMTREAADLKFIGKSLAQIEKDYGLALFVDKTKGQYRAFFRHLDLVEKERHYKGVFIDFDRNGLGTKIEYKDRGDTRWLDSFPYVEKAREYEPSKLMNFLLYDQYRFKPDWLRKLRKRNLVFALVVIAIEFVTYVLLLMLFFSFPFIIIAPVMQLFSFTRILGNGMVKLIFFLLYSPVWYLFFVLLVFIEDGFFIPFIGALFSYGFYLLFYFKRINYHRCPQCKTMYSALDEGSTYTGQSQSVEWGTYDVYKGKTETSDTITHNYERRSTKRVTTTDHYLDHRMCFRCYYEWDVDREESSSRTDYL